jgi:AcrR family transcriptional regulator
MNETKKFIIKTGLKLFLQKGYKEVTLRDLVQTTGLSKGAFYHHFESKEQLFKVIVSLFFNLEAIDYRLFPEKSLDAFYHKYVEAVTQSMHQLYTYIGGDPEEASYNFYLMMFDALRLFPEFMELEQQQYQQDRQAWEKVIAKAKKRKEIRSKVSDKELARLFLYTADGVSVRKINDDRSKSYQEELLEAFDALYAGLKS